MRGEENNLRAKMRIAFFGMAEKQTRWIFLATTAQVIAKKWKDKMRENEKKLTKSAHNFWVDASFYSRQMFSTAENKGR